MTVGSFASNAEWRLSFPPPLVARLVHRLIKQCGQVLIFLAQSLQSHVMKFTKAIFNVDETRYSTMEALSEDILSLAHRTAHSMNPSVS